MTPQARVRVLSLLLTPLRPPRLPQVTARGWLLVQGACALWVGLACAWGVLDWVAGR